MRWRGLLGAVTCGHFTSPGASAERCQPFATPRTLGTGNPTGFPTGQRDSNGMALTSWRRGRFRKAVPFIDEGAEGEDEGKDRKVEKDTNR